MRYFIFLSYRGTNYHGWQRQPGSPTVQQLLERVLSLKLGNETAVTGAGRTDAGVHASFYCAHFDAAREDLAGNSDFTYGLNRFLPPDVAIDRIVRVASNASARYSALSRTYVYRIIRRKDPFTTETGWHYSGELNVSLMNEASAILLEYNDFASFCRSDSDVKTTICKIESATWVENDSALEFHITADRFLRNMVRAITGTMIEIGQGKISLQDFRQIIESHDRTRAGQSAPAKGLFLTGVQYPPEIFEV
ncbi:MAG: tRNA pseudouridine(38-40) synthase TruA [Bacteroidales bacterium]|nr:tRNA pseudouridine(38-40) synthase TruA [Bacteroidales bacterium]